MKSFFKRGPSHLELTPHRKRKWAKREFNPHAKIKKDFQNLKTLTLYLTSVITIPQIGCLQCDGASAQCKPYAGLERTWRSCGKPVQ